MSKTITQEQIIDFVASTKTVDELVADLEITLEENELEEFKICLYEITERYLGAPCDEEGATPEQEAYMDSILEEGVRKLNSIIFS